MSDDKIYHSPRVPIKPSKLPRLIEKTVNEQAKGVSSLLKKMAENETCVSPKSSRSLMNSKIPFFRSSSDKSLSIRNCKKASVSSGSLDLNMLSLETLVKFDDKFQGKPITPEKQRIMLLVKEIPAVWVSVVAAIAVARNEMAQFLIDNNLDKEELSSTTLSIKQKIEAAKLATTNKLTVIERNIDETINKSIESERLLQTIKSQNKKITNLSAALKKSQAALEDFKLKSLDEKKELENKLIKVSTAKRGIEERLREKSEAMEKTLADLAAKTTENQTPVESLFTPVPEMVPIPAEKNTPNKNIRKTDSGKQVHLLKSTVKKLEGTIDKLSKQNENLRKMVSTAERRIYKEESQISGKNVSHALQKILNEKQQNLEKLSYMVKLIKKHHNASRDQQSQLDTRIELLQSRFDGL